MARGEGRERRARHWQRSKTGQPLGRSSWSSQMTTLMVTKEPHFDAKGEQTASIPAATAGAFLLTLDNYWDNFINFPAWV